MELLCNECTGSSNFESGKRIKYHMHGMTIRPDVKTFGRKFRRAQAVFRYPRKRNIVCCILEVYWVYHSKTENSENPQDGIPGGVLDISLGGEVRSGPSYPDPVSRQKSLIFLPCLRQNSDF